MIVCENIQNNDGFCDCMTKGLIIFHLHKEIAIYLDIYTFAFLLVYFLSLRIRLFCKQTKITKCIIEENSH